MGMAMSGMSGESGIFGAGADPSAPSNLSILTTGSTYVKLSWSAAIGTAPLTYQVYKSTDGISYTAYGSQVGTLSANIGGLSVSTLYYFKVTAINGAAVEGQASNVASTTTLALGVPGAVRNLTVTGHGATTVTVTFDAPFDTGGAAIDVYHAFVAPHGNSLVDVATTAGSPYTFTGLSPSQAYDLDIRAHNSQGVGPGNDTGVPVQQTTDAATAPDAPTSLASNGDNQATLIPLTWTDGADNGAAIINHKLRYRIGAGAWTTVVTGSVATTHDLYVGTGLESTTFEIEVASTNSVGDSSWSSSHGETTGPVWSPASVTGYYAEFDADHLILTGSTVDRIDDVSGNVRHLVYQSGTKYSQGANRLSTKNGIVIASSSIDGKYKSAADITFQSYFMIGSHLTSITADGGYFHSWDGHNQIHNVGGVNQRNKAEGTLQLTSSTQGSIESIAAYGKTTGGNETGLYKNGDFAGKVSNSTAPVSTTGVLSWGSHNGADFVCYGISMRKLICIAAEVSTTDRQKLEGYVHWDVPNFHLSLPVGHPYRDVSPTATVLPPGTPTVARAYPSASGQITVVVTPGDEGGATNTYTATGSPGGTGNSTSLSVDVGSLTNGTGYTFTLVASNLAGSSSASSASYTVTPTSSSLVTSLIAGFALAESSGATASDIFGGYDLANHGTVGTTTVPSSPAWRTFGGTSDYLSRVADNTNSCIGVDFSFCISAYPTSLAGGNKQWITNRNTGGGTNINYMIRSEGTTLKVYIGNGAGGFDPFTLATGLTINTVYNVAVCVDKTTKAVRASVNGGAAFSAGTAGSIPTTSLNMNFGIGGIDTTETMQGYLRGAYVAARKWTDPELVAASAGVVF